MPKDACVNASFKRMLSIRKDTISRLWYSMPFLVMVSVFLYASIEIFSPTGIGVFISYILFFSVALLSFFRLRYGILATLCLAVLIPEFPRNILDVYKALQVDKTVEYNVISTVTPIMANLLFYLLLFNSILVAFRIRLKISQYKMLIILGLLSLGSFAMLYDFLVGGRDFIARPVIVDVKFIIYISFGLVQGIYLREKKSLDLLLSFILVLPIIIGIRAIMFIVGDFIMKVPKLDLMTKPLISVSVIIFLIRNRGHYIYNSFIRRLLLFVSLFNTSRGEIFLVSISLAGFFLWSFGRNLKFKLRLAAEICLLLFLLVFAVYQVSPRLFDFFLWKVSEFSLGQNHEWSGSGMVRVYELKNITAKMEDDPIVALFGKGFGGSFDFKAYPFPLEKSLGLESYPEDQLNSGVFYETHSFTSQVLLKYGIVGFLIYLFIPLYLVFSKRPAGEVSSYYLLVGWLALLLIYNYYWRIESMVIMGIFLGTNRPSRVRALVSSY